MNTSKIKKGLSLLLSIIMIFTMMPVTIFTLGADVSYPTMMQFTAASSADFHKYYNKVYSVTFLDKIDETAIAGAIESWDISAAKDGSVMSWMYLNEAATAAAKVNRYDVYIAGEGGVGANPDSGWIFYLFSSLKEINNPENFKTKNATTFYNMFSSCSALKSVDFSSWDVSNVKTLKNMFLMCTALESVNLSGWNTGSVTDLTSMFDMNNGVGTPSLIDVDLSGWDTSNVTTMENMFRNCYALETLDLSSFNTRKVTSMRFMFYLCKKLNYIYAGDNWSLESIANLYDGVFNCCYAKFGVTEAEYTEAVQNGRQFDASASKATFEDGGYLTYKAPDAKEKYKVTYEYVGDVIPENVTLPALAEYEEGTTVTVADNPSADKYIFSGWSTTDATVENGEFVINNDVDFVGSWTKLYKVEYKYDDDYEVPTGAPEIPDVELWFAPGESVPLYGIPYVPEHVFVGWKTGDAEIIGDEFTMPENDVVIYGYYKKPVNSIEISGGELTIDIGGEKVKVEVFIDPPDATFSGVIYESGDETIVIVDNEGMLTPVSVGTTTITITSVDDPTKTDTVNVTVKIPVTDITVDRTEIDLNKGDTDTIVPEIKPDNATNKKVIYESSNPDVVKVDENGNIVAVGDGTAIITVTSDDNKTVKERVTVTVKTPVTDITAPKDVTIVVGETESLNAKVNEDATEKGLIYEVKDPSIAKVDSNGDIIAINEGTTEIVITSKDDPTITKTVIVKVIKYKVTYAFVGEDIPKNVIAPDGAEYGSGETVIVENNPTAKGYTFSGWTTDNAAVEDGKFDIYNDVHFVGSWSRNSYEVTYEYTGDIPDGAPAVPGKEVKSFGTTVEVKDAPTLDRYIFSGWTTENAAVEDGQFTMPDNNVKFVGHWEKIPVKDIIVDKTEITLNPNDTDKLIVKVTPDDATNKEVTFKSTDEDVVKVDENGNITAVGEGEAEIIVKADGKEITVKVTVEKPYIPVENIIVDKTEITLNPNDTDKITATVKPDDATNKEVTFESTDEDVVKVDENGNITAVGEGEAEIIIKADGKEITVKVTVEKPYIPVEDILIYKKEFELEPGDTDKIIAVVTPNEATDKDITYTSDDETVVKVDENGNITAVGEGTATITVASKADPTKSKTVTVKVEKVVVPVEDVLLHKQEFELEPGDTDKIIAVVTPNEATDKDITYTSDDETVVKVDENGNITAVGEGTATITVASKADPTKSKTVTVTVKKPPVKITAPEKITVVLGEEQDIGATINADTKLSYSSSDESIAKVDENGRITAVAEGEVKITVTAAGYPELKAIIIVKVSGKPSYSTKHYMVFGKTEKIGWYNVSLDGGETFLLVFGNSHLEVEHGQEVIIKAKDVLGDPFTFYINGTAVKPDENGYVRVIVDKYVLVGALGIPVEAPDVEESLNFFQRMIQAIKNFFAKIASWFKR